MAIDEEIIIAFKKEHSTRIKLGLPQAVQKSIFWNKVARDLVKKLFKGLST